MSISPAKQISSKLPPIKVRMMARAIRLRYKARKPGPTIRQLANDIYGSTTGGNLKLIRRKLGNVIKLLEQRDKIFCCRVNRSYYDLQVWKNPPSTYEQALQFVVGNGTDDKLYGIHIFYGDQEILDWIYFLGHGIAAGWANEGRNGIGGLAAAQRDIKQSKAFKEMLHILLNDADNIRRLGHYNPGDAQVILNIAADN